MLPRWHMRLYTCFLLLPILLSTLLEVYQIRQL
jgi:hypothetical protein